MLQTLKKNKKTRKHFTINSGNYGFLMNKFSSKDILKNLSKVKYGYNITLENDC